MNKRISIMNDYEPYINYVINVLQFDVFTFLKEMQNSQQFMKQNIASQIDNKALLHKISQTTKQTYVAVRDSLALLHIIKNGNFDQKEMSLNKTIDKAVKNLYFDLQGKNKDVSVSFHPLSKDVFLQCDELIVETVLFKIFDLAREQFTDSKVIVSASFESGFATITLQYQGKKHKMMNPSIELSEENELISSMPEFNNPYSLLKLFEQAGLGVLSFSHKEKFNIINFTLHLPSRETESAKPSGDRLLNKHDWKNKTVLIVDDIEVNFIFLETILADTGIKTLYATNGKIAVEMVKKHKEIDVVLMDIKMPVMDGYEATKIIKSEKPDLPVIIQTAYSFSEEHEQCSELGCSDYITKPLKSENVLSVLSKYLDN